MGKNLTEFDLKFIHHNGNTQLNQTEIQPHLSDNSKNNTKYLPPNSVTYNKNRVKIANSV